MDLAQHINLAGIDYPAIMREQIRHTYIYLALGGALSIVAFVFFIAELLPGVTGIGTAAVTIIFLLGLGCVFHAMRYQKEIETRVLYEVIQKIQAIEGSSGFLWRINTVINAYCQEVYGGLPEGVQQLQTSSQAGGIETSEIHLYKELLENVVNWYRSKQPEAESNG